MSGHDRHPHLPGEVCYSGIEDSCRERWRIYGIVRTSGTRLTTSEVARRLWPDAPASHHYNRVYAALRAMSMAGHVFTDGTTSASRSGRIWWVYDLPESTARTDVERWLDA